MAGLVNVSEMGALAFHMLVELAALKEEKPEARKTVTEIAAELNASVHTLQKVAHRLIGLGMIEGTRGANGGLRLAADPETTTLLDVIEGLESRVGCNGCLFQKRVCPEGNRCIFDGITGALERQVRRYFAETTLAALRDNALEPA